MGKCSKGILEKFLDTYLQKGKLTNEQVEKAKSILDEEIKKRPFRVAIIGQAGVGKTTTVNSLFGVEGYTSNIAEGTTSIMENIYEIRPGMKLALYDTPGLNNDIEKDKIYLQMYEELLPVCDVILYILSAESKYIGEDERILNEVILHICRNRDIINNLVIGINKIDLIGKNEVPKLKWDPAFNLPSKEQKILIKRKVADVVKKLSSIDGIQEDKIVNYSAVFNYNLIAVLRAIASTKRGYIWAGTVGEMQIKRREDLMKDEYKEIENLLKNN